MTDAAGEGADFEEGLTEAGGEPDGIVETVAPGEAAVAPGAGATPRGEAPTALGEAPTALGEAAGAALRTSPSSRPTRRAALCLAVSRVNNKVTAKKMHPR
ncbi:MAG TPA: hypothetical protein VGY91_10205 [Chthoniobacterales bacterium]|nr:hypothetical protein [Chthoniobacterales bacterium]